MSDRKEYIERGALLKEAESRLVWNHQAAGVAVYEAIQEAPAADVAEVVRCSRCKHYKTIGTVAGCARIGFECKNPDDYCSYGDRKDNATDNNVGSKTDGKEKL
jgi:hypothetical protein